LVVTRYSSGIDEYSATFRRLRAVKVLPRIIPREGETRVVIVVIIDHQPVAFPSVYDEFADEAVATCAFQILIRRSGKPCTPVAKSSKGCKRTTGRIAQGTTFYGATVGGRTPDGEVVILTSAGVWGNQKGQDGSGRSLIV
jgi:hypothetical protein